MGSDRASGLAAQRSHAEELPDGPGLRALDLGLAFKLLNPPPLLGRNTPHPPKTAIARRPADHRSSQTGEFLQRVRNAFISPALVPSYQVPRLPLVPSILPHPHPHPLSTTHYPPASQPTPHLTCPPVPSQLLIPSQTFLVTPTAPFDKASSKLLYRNLQSVQLQDSETWAQHPMRNLHDTWAQAVVVAVAAAAAN
ncbi:hypothetical protein PG997_004624 [Apiospora hydei]|uniref:Uncharacterized protein n=1 Tax=Apiospora hydei TaxID=1337664 RepID=A0ABR1X2M0_9PEZI